MEGFKFLITPKVSCGKEKNQGCGEYLKVSKDTCLMRVHITIITPRIVALAFNSNLCLDVNRADTTNVNRIWLYNCGHLLKSGFTLHILSQDFVGGVVLPLRGLSRQDNECTKDVFGIYKSWK